MWLTHSHDRAKDFLSHRDRFGVPRLDDRWLDKVSSRIVGVSTKQDFPALLLRFCDARCDLLECGFAAMDEESAAINSDYRLGLTLPDP